jgi:hypothetical protein
MAGEKERRLKKKLNYSIRALRFYYGGLNTAHNPLLVLRVSSQHRALDDQKNTSFSI